MYDGDDQDREAASWALECWSTFPFDHIPRALVLVGPKVKPDQGFRTARAENAFLAGAIDGDDSVPAGVLEILRRARSDTADHSNEIRVLVRNARLSETEFDTDRGRQLRSAWQLECDESNGSIRVLDPDVAKDEWLPPKPQHRPAPFVRQLHSALGASIDPTDRHLVFYFVGRPEKVADYRSAEVIETPSAISILPRMVNREPYDSRTLMSPVGRTRRVFATLRHPLCARVLVNLDASPVIVNRRETS